MTGADIIEQLAGIAPGSRLAELRAYRKETREYAQGSYRALLEPADPAGVSLIERDAIGLRVATLEADPDVADHHRARLAAQGMQPSQIEQIEQRGFAADLPDRLREIMHHVDLLTISPRTGSPEALESLKRAGMSARDIVTTSQLAAYLSYEIRMIALLRAMADGR